jgi:hypothetical protein
MARTRGFGTLRAMTPSGLGKKFDADRYADEMHSIYTLRMKEPL